MIISPVNRNKRLPDNELLYRDFECGQIGNLYKIDPCGKIRKINIPVGKVGCFLVNFIPGNIHNTDFLIPFTVKGQFNYPLGWVRGDREIGRIGFFTDTNKGSPYNVDVIQIPS